MTTQQTTVAITALEAQGHKFKLLPTGQVHVTNVTPPVRAFVTKFKEHITVALAARQQEQLARANFPGGAVVVERRTWPQIQQEWRDFVAEHGLDKLMELRILQRTIGELRGCDSEDIAIRLLSETWDTAPREVLEQLCFGNREQGAA